MKLRDKFWIWGQGAGTHHSAERFKLVGENKMSPIEGARYLGIPNMCRVVMDGDLQVPIDIDKEGVVLNELKNVIWSIYGSDRMIDSMVQRRSDNNCTSSSSSLAAD